MNEYSTYFHILSTYNAVEHCTLKCTLPVSPPTVLTTNAMLEGSILTLILHLTFYLIVLVLLLAFTYM